MSSSSQSSISSSSTSSSSKVESVKFYFSEQPINKQSLTITILNQSELSQKMSVLDVDTRNYLSGISSQRYRGDFYKRDAVWGFKETHLSTSGLASAVVFTGENVGIYIEPQGDGVGFVQQDGTDKLLFAKTSIQVCVYDLLRGIQKELSFSELGAEAEAAGRYIVWEVKEADALSKAYFATHGNNGPYLLSVTETSELYEDPDFTTPFESSDGSHVIIQNKACLQILSVWWKQILHDVSIAAPNKNVALLQYANVMTKPVNLAQPLSEQTLFDTSTVYPSYLRTIGTETFDMTPEQKAIVMRDFCWGLLSTQVPVGTSDCPSSPLIGIGIYDKNSSTANINTVDTVVDLYKFTSIDLSRLGSLDGSYVAYNSLDYLNALTSNHSQTSARVKNPLRVLSIENSDSASVGFSTSYSIKTRLLVNDWACQKSPANIQIGKSTEIAKPKFTVCRDGPDTITSLINSYNEKLVAYWDFNSGFNEHMLYQNVNNSISRSGVLQAYPQNSICAVNKQKNTESMVREGHSALLCYMPGTNAYSIPPFLYQDDDLLSATESLVVGMFVYPIEDEDYEDKERTIFADLKNNLYITCQVSENRVRFCTKFFFNVNDKDEIFSEWFDKGCGFTVFAGLTHNNILLSVVANNNVATLKSYIYYRQGGYVFGIGVLSYVLVGYGVHLSDGQGYNGLIDDIVAWTDIENLTQSVFNNITAAYAEGLIYDHKHLTWKYADGPDLNSSALMGNVSIGYELVESNKKVKSVSYEIGLNSNNYYKFLDKNGSLESIYVFKSLFDDFISNGGILNAVIGLLTSGSEIPDYYRVSRHLIDLDNLPYLNNTRAFQRRDGTGIVDIYYDYLNYDEKVQATVFLSVYKVDGTLIAASSNHFKGDIGVDIIPGLNRHISWKPFEDSSLDSITCVYVSIRLTDAYGRIARGELQTGTIVLDKSSNETFLADSARESEVVPGNLLVFPHVGNDIKAYHYESVDIKNREFPFEGNTPVFYSSSSSLAIPSSESTQILPSSESTEILPSSKSTKCEHSSTSSTALMSSSEFLSSDEESSPVETSLYDGFMLGVREARIDELFRDVEKDETGDYIIIDW